MDMSSEQWYRQGRDFEFQLLSPKKIFQNTESFHKIFFTFFLYFLQNFSNFFLCCRRPQGPRKQTVPSPLLSQQQDWQSMQWVIKNMRKYGITDGNPNLGAFLLTKLCRNTQSNLPYVDGVDYHTVKPGVILVRYFGKGEGHLKNLSLKKGGRSSQISLPQEAVLRGTFYYSTQSLWCSLIYKQYSDGGIFLLKIKYYSHILWSQIGKLVKTICKNALKHKMEKFWGICLPPPAITTSLSLVHYAMNESDLSPIHIPNMLLNFFRYFPKIPTIP